ncbi:hypothetical protein G9A89_018729 [Geosiphon pyriformis]|nr:hypothetical protein G9A89_018729 [Geosiphon pyriformis]
MPKINHWQQETRICHYCGKQEHIQIDFLNSELSIKLNTISNYLPANDAAINLSATSILSSNLLTNSPNLSATATGNVSTATTNNLSTPNNSDPVTKLTDQQSPKAENYTAKLEINSGARNSQNPNSQNYLSFLVTSEDTSPSNQKPTQKQTHTSNILPATVTNNKSLNAIFPFELKEPSTTPLFSGAALEEKPNTIMYTDAKIDGHHIKLILDSGSAGSIITRQFMDQLGCRVNRAASARIIMADGATKTPIGEIDDLPIEINSIIVPIKVLVMEATQYQALVGNDWLSKTNATLNWNTQELQLSQNRQHTNCRQWAHAMATMKNIRQQLSSIAAHAMLNVLEDRNEWENEIIHHV